MQGTTSLTITTYRRHLFFFIFAAAAAVMVVFAKLAFTITTLVFFDNKNKNNTSNKTNNSDKPPPRPPPVLVSLRARVDSLCVLCIRHAASKEDEGKRDILTCPSAGVSLFCLSVFYTRHRHLNNGNNNTNDDRSETPWHFKKPKQPLW